MRVFGSDFGTGLDSDFFATGGAGGIGGWSNANGASAITLRFSESPVLSISEFASPPGIRNACWHRLQRAFLPAMPGGAFSIPLHCGQAISTDMERFSMGRERIATSLASTLAGRFPCVKDATALTITRNGHRLSYHVRPSEHDRAHCPLCEDGAI